MLNIFFFFFQAEDGIRDSSVTGVQTCALPISDEVWGRADDLEVDGRAGDGQGVGDRPPGSGAHAVATGVRRVEAGLDRADVEVAVGDAQVGIGRAGVAGGETSVGGT